MVKLNKQVCKVYPLIFLFFLLTFNSLGQTPNDDILNQRINLNLKDESLFQICATLAKFKGIPIGLEGNIDFEYGKNATLKIQSGTLREVLNSIIKQEPDYTWEIRDGVVNIFPINARDNSIKTLLETKTKTFFTKKEGGRIEIRDNINDIEDVKTLISIINILFSISVSHRAYVKDETTDINISNVNLKEILDKVVKKSSDSKMWTIQKVKDDDVVYLSF